MAYRHLNLRDGNDNVAMKFLICSHLAVMEWQCHYGGAFVTTSISALLVNFIFFNFDSRRIDWRAYPEAIFFFISVFKYKQFLTFLLLLFGVTLQAKIFLIYV